MSGHPVNKIARRQKGFIPKMQRERRVRKKSQASLNNMMVFALRNPVLLRGVRAGHSMRDTRALAVGVQPVIFTTPIGLNSFNLSS
jgi:hypothetical protein